MIFHRGGRCDWGCVSLSAHRGAHLQAEKDGRVYQEVRLTMAFGDGCIVHVLGLRERCVEETF